MDVKSINMAFVTKLFSSQSANDLNHFLEELPQNAGRIALIAAGIVWAFAAFIGLTTTVKVQELIELSAELKDTEASKPLVPRVRDVPLSQAKVGEFTKVLAKTYPNLSIKNRGAVIQITAKSTGLFGVFREAVGHVQNGGQGWRVSVEKMCVGRECKNENLGALLKINKVSVDKPS